MTKKIFAFITLGVVISAIPSMITNDTEICNTEVIVETEELEIVKVETVTTTSPLVESFTPLDIPLESNVQEYLKNKCDENSIDFALVLALMKVESEFVVDAVSKTNDYGLMQINKCNHKSLSLATGATDFLNPYDNIDAGIYILNNLFDKYEDAELVLMAYHFGERGANKLWNKGRYTSEYSQAILEKQQEFQRIICAR